MRNIFQLLFTTKAQSTARAYPGLCGTKQLSVVMVCSGCKSITTGQNAKCIEGNHQQSVTSTHFEWVESGKVEQCLI